MNEWFAVGYIINDPKITLTKDGNKIIRFGISVKRKYNNDKNAYDVVNCVAFSNLAEHIHKYCKKGDKIAIFANIQSNSYINKYKEKSYYFMACIEKINFFKSTTKVDELEYEVDIPF